MKRIILSVGPPAIGKSTWALEQVRKTNGKFKRLNLDDMRDMCGITSFDPTEEKSIQDAMYAMGLKLLNDGYDIIADNTNLSDKSWLAWCDIARKVGDCIVEEKTFDSDISLKELLKRNSLRSRNVPDGVIEKMYKKWIHKVKNDPIYFPSVGLLNSIEQYEKLRTHKRACIIIDLDGTLAIHTDRDIFDYMKSDQDVLNSPLAYIINALSKFDVDVIIVSGRSDNCLQITKDWLYVHDVHYDEIYMKPLERESDDDVSFKTEIYEKYIKDIYNVIAVFDDRDKVVSMWRLFNLPVYQVYNGDF